jgi:hypothetical protein
MSVLTVMQNIGDKATRAEDLHKRGSPSPKKQQPHLVLVLGEEKTLLERLYVYKAEIMHLPCLRTQSILNQELTLKASSLVMFQCLIQAKSNVL